MHLVHECAQTEEQATDRPGYGEAGKIRGPFTRRNAHGVQARHRIGERAHEDAENQLIGPVPQEVPQYARRELGRGELQCDDGEAEHQGDDRDRRSGNPDEQRARIVGRSLEHQPVQRRAGRDVEGGQPGTDAHREHDRDGRQHPQRAAQIFPQCFAPVQHPISVAADVHRWACPAGRSVHGDDRTATGARAGTTRRADPPGGPPPTLPSAATAETAHLDRCGFTKMWTQRG
jgi:hypothetical protein